MSDTLNYYEYICNLVSDEIEAISKEIHNSDLIAEFLEILDAVEISNEVMILALRSYKYYKLSHLTYHNFSHIVDVLRALFKLTNGFIDKEVRYSELILAACYHDAIYVPGCRYNENLSANVFDSEATDLRLDICGHFNLDHFLVLELIKGTKVSNHLSSHIFQAMEMKLLMDADMSSLAFDYSKFRENNKGIIYENLLPGEPITMAHLSKSCDFLKLFVNKNSIFRTVNGKKLMEGKARANILTLQLSIA